MALYKVVGPDGKVTYTDRAPVDKPSQSLKTNGTVTDTASLPFELRQAVSRFPVTLYTMADCSTCDQARSALKARGIPFTEKTVRTAEDGKALQKLEGSSSLPIVRIGTQQLKGFASRDWQTYLDAAGYPKQSVLPKNYQWPAPAPLTAVPPKAAPSAPDADANRAPVSPPQDPTSNPAGIQF
jgi:glutaredoxin